jgi:hypothetical protein
MGKDERSRLVYSIVVRESGAEIKNRLSSLRDVARVIQAMSTAMENVSRLMGISYSKRETPVPAPQKKKS